jgi:two-component system KDP operon response regulator KdpE
MLGRTLVLIVDGHRADLEETKQLLHANGFDTAEAGDGLSGLRQFFNLHPDIVIVDLAVSEMSGWKVVRRIREMSETPVIVTAADATNEDAAEALDVGVEGFLTKPYDARDLIARLNAGRTQSMHDDEEKWVYRRNGLTVDLRSCEVFVHGEPVGLTSTEYRLLTYLIDRRGWVLSHDQILSHVWGSDYIGERNQVKLYIWYLRKKLEHDPARPQLIVTRRGLGYAFAG